MAASIADVARRANVSISTVSRVANGSSLVNAKTRQRVEQAINELGYRPNAFARGLMMRRSDVIGLVLPDMHGEFYSEIIRGACEAARARGYSLIVSSTRETSVSSGLLETITQGALLDGAAILVSEVDEDIESSLGKVRFPLVLIDDELDTAPHDSVLIDQRRGAKAMMAHLLETCRMRRVIFVGGHPTNVDTRARLEVYHASLKSAGVSAEKAVYHLDYAFDSAYELARTEAPKWVGERHCAFAANDEMAAGIVAAALSLGIRVPEDLAVVGFDDTRVARMTQPPLTTVHVPMSEMGARAIDMLCDRIADPERPIRRELLSPRLVQRRSCGAPA